MCARDPAEASGSGAVGTRAADDLAAATADPRVRLSDPRPPPQSASDSCTAALPEVAPALSAGFSLVTDLTGRVLFAEPGAAQLLGIAPLVGRDLRELLPAGAWGSLEAALQQTTDDALGQWCIEPSSPGALAPLLVSPVALCDAAGAPTAVAWRLRRAASEVPAPAERGDALRRLLEEIGAVAWCKDAEGKLLYVSQGVCRICGYRAEELTAAEPLWWERIHPEDAKRVAGAYRSLCEGQSGFEIEYRIVSRDGACIWVRDRAMVDAASGRAHGLIMDISGSKRDEEELRQCEAEFAHLARLNTMGDMAAVLAHELNQPLAAIVNYVQGSVRRLQSGVTEPAGLCAVLEEVQGQAERAGEIIRRLRTFVSKAAPSVAPADVNRLVRDVASLARPEAGQKRVELRLELAEALPPVAVDAIQIQQVILNLMRNGLEAMAGTTSGDPRELGVRTTLAPDGSEVEVAVSDQGAGVRPELANEIFSPFFTTKPQGMGIGLSLSRSIVRAHRGRMWMTPNAEGGTTFRFTLPVQAS
jgi:two-component system, LuxR family, sensor histidine kinase DctS